MLRNEITKAGVRFGHCDFEEGPSSAIHRPGSSPIHCPIPMCVNLDKLFPSLNIRTPCILSGDQYNTTYLVGLF